MGIGEDSFELKKMFDKDMKEAQFLGIAKDGFAAPQAPTKPATEPAIEPEVEPGVPKPSKPRSPIMPKPGVSPKPKAKNKDVDVFLRQRGLANA